MPTSKSSEMFTIERHGDLTLVVATPALEVLEPGLEEEAAELILNAIRDQDGPLIVFDLDGVEFFGSMFMGVLLRCWKLTTSSGGMMALAGVTDHARELLHLTSLDMIWPMYKDRREAMEALLAD